MSWLAGLTVEAAPGVHLLPVLHERVDLAGLTRAVLDAMAPAAVAVELPTTLAAAAQRAVTRLPRISVVLSEEGAGDSLVWAVTPGDALVEGLRWAAEHACPTVLIDPDVRYRHRHLDALPDAHALWQLGPAQYLRVLRSVAGAGPVSPADELREKGMAFHIQEARQRIDGTLLCLIGAAHVDRVARLLAGPVVQPLARQQRSSVSLLHLHPESLTALLPDPPLAHAVFESIRGGNLPPTTGFASTVARRVELVREGLRLITGETSDDVAARRRSVVAYAARHATGELLEHTGPALDREALTRIIWQVAAASYREQSREQTRSWQRRLFFDFARRYARRKGLLIPGLYELVVAGRGVADDNLAWEIFDCARIYPWQEEEAEIPTARIDGDLLDLGTRTVRFRRRFFRTKQRPVAVPVRHHHQTDDPGEWLRAFDTSSICSYPPEDVVLEDYGHFLQQKACSVIAAEQSRSEPFSTSMLDGVDVRETLHHWYEGTVWVRETGRGPGTAGSVVVIFDDDRTGAEYPYLMSWLGEHEQESDMAFYATDPAQQIVGPGIMRATHGGFMLTYPPGRLADVWHDADYRQARSKPEVLLLAGIDYSVERTVVVVAAAPPSPRISRYAARQSKRIVYLPIGSLSPVTLRKLRVLHILAGRDKRAIAKDYIW